MYPTDIKLDRRIPYTSIIKAVQMKTDSQEPAFVSMAVCGKILIGDSEEIRYDYNKFVVTNSENKRILNTILKSFESPEKESEDFCGSLEIYFRKSFEEKIEKFSVKISNKIYVEYDRNYLKYILQCICVLFENNFLEDTTVIIERAILNVHTELYLCTEDYVPYDECEEYSTIIYDIDRNIGYELRFKDIVASKTDVRETGRIEEICLDHDTHTMQLFISQLKTKAMTCTVIPASRLQYLPAASIPRIGDNYLTWV